MIFNKNTFEEIFFGEIAQGFRRKLAEGELPILLRAVCAELKNTEIGSEIWLNKPEGD